MFRALPSPLAATAGPFTSFATPLPWEAHAVQPLLADMCHRLPSLPRGQRGTLSLICGPLALFEFSCQKRPDCFHTPQLIKTLPLKVASRVTRSGVIRVAVTQLALFPTPVQV